MNKRIALGVALASAGLIAVIGIGILVAGGADRRAGALLKDSRAYVAGHFLLELDGIKAGFVKSVEGCGIRADVIDAQPGADNVVRKHIGQPAYEPCVVTIGLGMDKSVYNWIASTLNSAHTRKNVVIVAADYNYKEKSRTTLYNALIQKVTFPALDAGSKDSAEIRLTIEPEYLRKDAGSGADVKGSLGKAIQKKWLPSNFRLTLNGVNDLDRVGKISALEVSQKVVADDIGDARDYQKEPGRLQVGNLNVSIAASYSASMDAWFKDFVIDGNNAQSNEKAGTLEFLAPNMKDVLFTLSLQGVGIFRSVEPPREAGSEQIAQWLYSLYVEQVSFTAQTGAEGWAAGSTGTTTKTTTTTQQTTTQATPATKTVVQASIGVISAALLSDGETFTISDGSNPPVTFEFDFDGKAAGVPIALNKEAPAREVAAAIVEAINGLAGELEMTAKNAGEDQIQLVNERGGAEGEEKILEFVEDERFQARDAVVEKEPEGLAAPTELKATTGGAEGEIELSWLPSKGALGYLVLFTTEPGGEYLELDRSEGTELTLAGLKSRVTHHFVVRALDGTNESKNSNEASAPAG